MSGNSIFEPTPQWHQVDLPPIKHAATKLSDEEIAQKKTHAKQLLRKENEAVDMTKRLSSSDRHFVSNILASGTLDDKVSALTLLVQESPLHSLKTLDTLLAMSKKKARKEAVMALQSLKDLFIGSVLPDRKLKYFVDQPLGFEGVEDKHLMIWYFEDHLKKYYFQVVQQLEALSHDTLTHVRQSAVRCIYDLLSGKPEQEQNLLKLLVNKLGDSDNKIAAKTSQLLIELLITHPGMKPFVVREIEQLLLLPDVSERAQYYSINTLNQTILTGKDTAVANKLIEIYFIFFRRLLKLQETEENGESKIVPVKEKNDKKKTKKGKGKNKKSKAAEKKKNEAHLDDLRAKMVAAILTGVNRAFHFAKISDEVVEKHLDILFKITHTGLINTAIQALSLIFTISLSRPAASDRFYRTLYESLLDTRLLITSKQTQYLNLLFKAVRADADLKRVKAFVKRMVQIAGHHQPPFICGIFYLLNQIMDTHPGVRAMLTTAEEGDEEEHFEDATDEDEDDESSEKSDRAEKQTPKKPSAIANYYDGRKRDPRFSNADKSCLWELLPFRKHYHPSVAKYAEMLFNGEKFGAQPDMHHYTLIHFLDRFVYRNPKKSVTTRGQSIMQPLPGRQDGGILKTRGNAQDRMAKPVNSEEFWRKKIEDVPVDEIFFHKYFKQKRSGEDLDGTTKKKQKTDQDAESDVDEDEVWRAMMSSIPGGLDGIDDADPDDDDEEFDDDEMRALLENEDDDDDEEEVGSDIEMQEYEESDEE
ncbi:CBF/Mak21 family-domain-containing protein [Dichotomocladium elegans]|nr:CBF/Mak21 family-domain-containing protein [Dichotomocladium elegans]